MGLKQVESFVGVRFKLVSWLTCIFFLGWDYSTRFVSLPVAGGTNYTTPALRSLDVKNHIPVDLNAILCKLDVRCGAI